jgi:D-amino-acid oxidase
MFDVVVVGAGVSGLSCAIRLQQAGARVAVVTADEPRDTVSSVAAAVWYPTRTAADPRVLHWAGLTFDELTDQAARGVPGVTMRTTRMLLRGSTATPWWASAVPDFRPAGPALPPYTGEWHFTVPAVEMSHYLDWLAQQVTDAGGVFLRRSLERLADAADLAPSIVNATGLGARTLAGDPAGSCWSATRGWTSPCGTRTTRPGARTSIRAASTSCWAGASNRGSGIWRRARRPAARSSSAARRWCRNWPRHG